MAIERTPGYSTGIYREPSRTTYTGSDMQKALEAFTDAMHWKFDLPARLDDIEAMAKKTIEDAGYKRGTVPRDVDPSVRDADQLAALVVLVRSCRKKGKHDDALVHMMELGTRLDQMSVRPIEARLWLRITDAAKALNVHKGQITQSAGPEGSDKPIVDNGRRWRRRRVRWDTVVAWGAKHHERVNGSRDGDGDPFYRRVDQLVKQGHEHAEAADIARRELAQNTGSGNP